MPVNIIFCLSIIEKSLKKSTVRDLLTSKSTLNIELWCVSFNYALELQNLLDYIPDVELCNKQK